MTHKRPWLPHQVVPWGKQWRHIKGDVDRQGGEFASKPTAEERIQQTVAHIKAIDKTPKYESEHGKDALSKLAANLREQRKHQEAARQREAKHGGRVSGLVERHDVEKGRRYDDRSSKTKMIGGEGGKRRHVSEGEEEGASETPMKKPRRVALTPVTETVSNPVFTEAEKPVKSTKRVVPTAVKGKADIAELETITPETFEKLSKKEKEDLSDRLLKAKRDRFADIIDRHEAAARAAPREHRAGFKLKKKKGVVYSKSTKRQYKPRG